MVRNARVAATAGRSARQIRRSRPPFQPSEPLAEADAAQLSKILTARHEGQLGNTVPAVLQELDQTSSASCWSTWPASGRCGLAEVLRVASFYDRFHLEPTGRLRAPRAMPGDAPPAGKTRNRDRRRARPDRKRLALRTQLRFLGLCTALSPRVRRSTARLLAVSTWTGFRKSSTKVP